MFVRTRVLLAALLRRGDYGMLINVEILGGSLIVPHYVEEIGNPIT
jgi:hypothetical protein